MKVTRSFSIIAAMIGGLQLPAGENDAGAGHHRGIRDAPSVGVKHRNNLQDGVALGDGERIGHGERRSCAETASDEM